MKIEQGMYFPTPIWTISLDEAEVSPQALIDWVHALREADPSGVQKSNVGGWQSPSDLHRHPEFGPLRQAIEEAAGAISRQYEVYDDAIPVVQNAWANVNDLGAANAVHVHAGSAFSGSYYARVPEGSGDIEFVDPRGLAIASRMLYPQPHPNRLTNSRLTLTPKAGTIIMFPGWLQHYVHPNQTDEERVGFAFNMSFVKG